MICMYLRDKSTNNLCSSSSANSVNFLLLLTNKVAFCWFNLTEQEPRIFNSLSAISDSMNSLVSSGKTSKAFLKLDTKLDDFLQKVKFRSVDTKFYLACSGSSSIKCWSGSESPFCSASSFCCCCCSCCVAVFWVVLVSVNNILGALADKDKNM